MKKLLVIGIGAGNPDYITLQAVKALNRVDVFFIMDKGQSKDKLIDLRRELCERHHRSPLSLCRSLEPGARAWRRRLQNQRRCVEPGQAARPSSG